MVGIQRIDTYGNGFDTALIKLGLQFGGVAKFRGADGRKILGVREQHHPIVAGPLVKVDRSMDGFLCEVWGDVAQTKSGHDWSPIVCRWGRILYSPACYFTNYRFYIMLCRSLNSTNVYG